MRSSVIIAALGACVLGITGPVAGHHAFSSEFDANKPVILRGTVVRTEWINPHAWVYIDVKSSDGRIETWAIECGAPNALLRRGWTKQSMPIGSEIVVDGFASKKGATTANAKDITTADGQKMFVGSSGTGAPYEKQ